jgi:hypothetical protein
MHRSVQDLLRPEVAAFVLFDDVFIPNRLVFAPAACSEYGGEWSCSACVFVSPRLALPKAWWGGDNFACELYYATKHPPSRRPNEYTALIDTAAADVTFIRRVETLHVRFPIWDMLLSFRPARA